MIKMSKLITEEKVKEFLQYDKVELDPESFPEPEFEKKTPKAGVDPETGKTEEVIPYYSAPLIHKTRGADGKYRTDQKFEVEGPILTSDGGIVVRKAKGKYQASVWVSHDLDNEMVKNFCGAPIDASDFMKMPEKTITDEEGEVTPGKDSLGFFSQLYLRCVCYAFAKRDKIGVTGCKGIAGFEALFKHPLKWTYNPDGTPMDGRNPSKYYNVFLLGDPSNKGRKAPFAMPVEECKEFPTGEMELDWCLLQDVRLSFRPLLEFASIYCGGGKLSIQVKIKSAVVYGFPRLSNTCQQKVTLAEARKDGDLLSTLKEQLAKAREMMASSGGGLKLAEPIKKKDGEEEEAKPVVKAAAKTKAKTIKLEEEEEEEEQPKKNKKVAASLKKPLKKKIVEAEAEEEENKNELE
jgi:hypothetical protein